MSLVLSESLVLAKTRSQDLKSVLKLNCWGSGIKDVSLIRQLVNVEVVCLSCNEITTLEDFAHCLRLKELILRKNNIKNIAEIAHLQGLPKLTTLWLGENPCVENTHNYRKIVLKALPNLTILDNKPVTREELQEIEELGNEIYEEVPYESSNSSGSGPSSTVTPTARSQPSAEYETGEASTNQESLYSNASNTEFINEASYNQIDQNETSVTSANGSQNHGNELQYTVSSMSSRTPHNSTRSSNIHQQQSRCLSLQGSVTTLNGGQQQSWMSNNNSFLPKGGKSRNGNILSAVLCLVKELDYVSCEVVQTALHCRMEETFQ